MKTSTALVRAEKCAVAGLARLRRALAERALGEAAVADGLSSSRVWMEVLERRVMMSATGDPARGFGVDRWRSAPLPGIYPAIMSAAVAPGAKVYAVAVDEASADPFSLHTVLARLNADGTLDSHFGKDGIVVLPGENIRGPNQV